MPVPRPKRVVGGLAWGGTHPQADQRSMGLGSKRGPDARMGVRPSDPEGTCRWEVGEEVKGHGGGE